MIRKIFYGNQTIEVDLPDEVREIKPPKPIQPISNPEESIRKALENPIAHEPIRKLVKPGFKVTMAFDDCAAPFTPMAPKDFREMAIPILMDELVKCGVKPSDIRLVCAIGLHRKWTRRELSNILGEEIALKMLPNKLYCHDGENQENLVYLGETSRGMEVEVAKEVLESDQLFYVNVTASPFNGGWKSVVVGLGSFRSIRHHHRPFPSKGHSPMDPFKSAFRRVLWEMGDLIRKRLEEEGKRIFTIESVLNNEPNPKLIGVYAGHPPEVHEKTLDLVCKQQVVEVEGQSDILIIGVPNLSPYAKYSIMNPILVVDFGLEYGFRLYQNKPVVKKDGILILIHPFDEEFNDIHHPSYIEFYNKVLAVTKDPFEAWDLFAEDFARRPEYIQKYRFGCAFHGSHPFFMWNSTEFPKRYLREIFVAETRNFKVVEKLGFKPFKTLDEALKEAKQIMGKDATITYHQIQPITIAKVT